MAKKQSYRAELKALLGALLEESGTDWGNTRYYKNLINALPEADAKSILSDPWDKAGRPGEIGYLLRAIDHPDYMDLSDLQIEDIDIKNREPTKADLESGERHVKDAVAKGELSQSYIDDIDRQGLRLAKEGVIGKYAIPRVPEGSGKGITSLSIEDALDAAERVEDTLNPNGATEARVTPRGYRLHASEYGGFIEDFFVDKSLLEGLPKEDADVIRQIQAKYNTPEGLSRLNELILRENAKGGFPDNPEGAIDQLRNILKQESVVKHVRPGAAHVAGGGGRVPPPPPNQLPPPSAGGRGMTPGYGPRLSPPGPRTPLPPPPPPPQLPPPPPSGGGGVPPADPSGSGGWAGAFKRSPITKIGAAIAAAAAGSSMLGQDRYSEFPDVPTVPRGIRDVALSLHDVTSAGMNKLGRNTPLPRGEELAERLDAANEDREHKPAGGGGGYPPGGLAELLKAVNAQEDDSLPIDEYKKMLKALGDKEDKQKPLVYDSFLDHIIGPNDSSIRDNRLGFLLGLANFVDTGKLGSSLAAGLGLAQSRKDARQDTKSKGLNRQISQINALVGLKNSMTSNKYNKIRALAALIRAQASFGGAGQLESPHFPGLKMNEVLKHTISDISKKPVDEDRFNEIKSLYRNLYQGTDPYADDYTLDY